MKASTSKPYDSSHSRFYLNLDFILSVIKTPALCPHMVPTLAREDTKDLQVISFLPSIFLPPCSTQHIHGAALTHSPPYNNTHTRPLHCTAHGSACVVVSQRP